MRVMFSDESRCVRLYYLPIGYLLCGEGGANNEMHMNAVASFATVYGCEQRRRLFIFIALNIQLGCENLRNE